MYSQRNQILNNQQLSFNVDNNTSNNQFLNKNYQPNSYDIKQCIKSHFW